MADTFHVSPNGNDQNPGTKRKPFATLQAARDTARARGGTGHVILLAPGRYFNTGSIVLDDRDSGLTIKGAQRGAVAEIYGGVPVTGWEKWKDTIWRARVPKGQRFFNLIVDGKPATMAQTPNAGSGYGGGAQKLSNTAIRVPPAWRGYDYSDAQVFAFLDANWFSEMREVLKPSLDANGVLSVGGGSGSFNGMNDRFFIRGVLEFLDEPGEWCLKHKEGYVYYWPKTGTPADHMIVRSTVENLFVVRGRSMQTPAENIAFQNLSVIGSDFCAQWKAQDLPKALVIGENVKGLTVAGCRLLAAGQAGIVLLHYAENCVIENNLIADAGYAGICAQGYAPGEGPFKSGPESDVNKGHRIVNNFIYDCGKYVGDGCGIQFYQAGTSLIARNEIGQTPRYGISFKGIPVPKICYGHPVTFADHYQHLHTHDIKVTGNEIYSVDRNSQDFGAIESWCPGRDNLWADNDLHDIDQPCNWNEWAHILFADDNSDYLTMRGNIIHHCDGGWATGAFMMKNIEDAIVNNLVVDCHIGRLVTFEAAGPPLWNNSIVHNIFAVDGMHTRYGFVNEYSLKGKTIEGAQMPAGASGFKEIDDNWITPRDPKDPNPLFKDKMDLHSTFGPAPVQRTKPYWDATAEDYVVTNPPPWFTSINTAQMGLKKDFPFDTRAFTRRLATDKIQAEDYQRTWIARTTGGYGIYNLQSGAWTKYSNIDFGKGVRKAVFQLDAPQTGSTPSTRFIHRSGNSVVDAIPFKGDMSVETVPQWEISKPYTKAGKTGPELFDEVFPPETDSKTGQWSLFLQPLTSKGGVTSEKGVVDFDVANGEEIHNACAYARAAIYAPIGRTNASMTITSTGGVKVWFNGELIIAANKPGTYAIQNGVIREGWNTVLVKVNQQTGAGGFSFKFGTVASSCGKIVALPGLPVAAEESSTPAESLIELRLDSPSGKVIGRILPGQSACEIENAVGIHNLYLVFPGGAVNSVDWFKFEKDNNQKKP